MRSYSEREVFSQREMTLFRQATTIVDELPDVDVENRILRCHEVARVVAHFLNLEVQDGVYELGAEHSWCAIPRSRHILDPYAIARLPPVQLVARATSMPWRYNPGPHRDDVRTDVVQVLIEHIKLRVVPSYFSDPVPPP